MECTSTSDCQEGSFCCQGACVADEPKARCGCSPAPGGVAGEACGEGQLCIVAGARATAETVADGICACPCDPSSGGTICAVDAEVVAGFSCSCDRSDPVGTCEAPALDDERRPHRVADTCTPDLRCVCFASGSLCPTGTDCTAGGCLDLLNDPENCGIAGRVCAGGGSDAGPEGTCVTGGCTCTGPSECRGDGLNVDACQFVVDVEPSRCVCAGYRVDDVPAACPLGLACAQGGCVFAGTAYATEQALLEAMGVKLPEESSFQEE